MASFEEGNITHIEPIKKRSPAAGAFLRVYCLTDLKGRSGEVTAAPKRVKKTGQDVSLYIGGGEAHI